MLIKTKLYTLTLVFDGFMIIEKVLYQSHEQVRSKRLVAAYMCLHFYKSFFFIPHCFMHKSSMI